MSNAKKIRVTNFLGSLILIGLGVLEIFFGKNSGIASHVPSVYLIVFGLMMGGSDFNAEFILDWCGFLGHFMYRGIFTIYCSVHLFNIHAKMTDMFQPIAYFASWIIFALGTFLLVFGAFVKSDKYTGDVQNFINTKSTKESDLATPVSAQTGAEKIEEISPKINLQNEKEQEVVTDIDICGDFAYEEDIEAAEDIPVTDESLSDTSEEDNGSEDLKKKLKT